MVAISIIMPVYNDESVLKQSIESVIKQSLKDIELICINDGSTDNSLNILNDFADKNDFIKVISQENQGSGKARNHGMDIAQGEYIGFLDADDYFIDDDALERLYEVANLNDANMASGNILHDVDNPGEFIPFKHLEYFTEDKVILPEEYGLPWSFYKSIFKKDFLLSNEIYFPDLLRGQDPVFLAEILVKVDKIYAVATDVYAYVFYDAINRCNTYRKLYDQLLHYKIVFEYMDEPRFYKANYDFRKAFYWFVNQLNESDSITALNILNEIFEGNIRILHDIHRMLANKFKDNSEIIDLCIYKDGPKISVIVPVYNAEPFLDEAINSVLNQSFDDFEVICVNDGSLDNSLEMLNNFAQKDSRIKVFSKENGGCGSARNRALDEAIGDYVYFFDPDDYILPNTFEELYNNAVNNNSDLVIFKIARFKDGGEIDYSVPGFELEKIFKNKDFNNFTFNYKDIKKYVLNSSFAPWTKLYKKEFLDRFDDFRFETGIAYDDAPFHIQSMLRASKISFIPDFFYFYRFNPNSIINTSSNGMDIFRIIEIVKKFLIENNYYEEFLEEFKFFKLVQIFNYLLSTDSEEYFQQAKFEFSKMYLGYNHMIDNYLLPRFNLVLKCNTFEEYKLKEHKLQIREFNKNINKYKKSNQKLAKKNRNLEKKLKKLKKTHDEIYFSHSWQVTKRFRR